MLCVLIILLIITLIFVSFSVLYITIDIHLKNRVLLISIGNKIWKKKYNFDFTKDNKTPAKKNKKKDKQSASGNNLSSIKGRILDEGGRINFDELKKVRTEFTETYSNIIAIIKTIFGKLRYKVKIPTVKITLEYGTGDAAATGMIYGSIWGTVGIFYPILSKWAHISYSTLDITPDFYGKRFNIEIQSIIKVRPAHIINAVIATIFSPNLTYLKNKLKKGRGKNG